MWTLHWKALITYFRKEVKPFEFQVAHVTFVHIVHTTIPPFLGMMTNLYRFFFWGFRSLSLAAKPLRTVRLGRAIATGYNICVTAYYCLHCSYAPPLSTSPMIATSLEQDLRTLLAGWIWWKKNKSKRRETVVQLSRYVCYATKQ